MNGANPRIRSPRTSFDHTLEAACVAALVLVFGLVGANYETLPDRIPMHFNFSGVPDGWGSRDSLWMLAGLAAGINALFLGVSFIKPWYWNIPVKVTPENAVAVYRVSRRMLTTLRFVFTLMFALMVVGIIRVARGEAATLSPLFLWPSLGAALLTIAGFFVRLVQVSRTSESSPNPLAS